jgi:hypothetical protein
MVNAIEVLPASTFTLVAIGTAVLLLLASVMAIPAAGAGPFKVSVPVTLVPPLTVPVLSVNAFTSGGNTVSVVVADVRSVAVSVTFWLAATAAVVTGNE